MPRCKSVQFWVVCDALGTTFFFQSSLISLLVRMKQIQKDDCKIHLQQCSQCGTAMTWSWQSQGHIAFNSAISTCQPLGADETQRCVAWVCFYFALWRAHVSLYFCIVHVSMFNFNIFCGRYSWNDFPQIWFWHPLLRNSFGTISETTKFIRDGCHPTNPLISGLLGQLDFIFSNSQAGRLHKFEGVNHEGATSNLKRFAGFQVLLREKSIMTKSLIWIWLLQYYNGRFLLKVCVCVYIYIV